MRGFAAAVVLGSVLTVEQRDAHRSDVDPPSAAVSADGRYVALTTTSSLVPADRDQRPDVYVLDRLTQRVTLESPSLEGPAPAYGAHPAISGDGRYVAYEAGDRVLLHDRHRDATRDVDEGRQPAISRDGRTLAFTSDSRGHLVLYDVEKGTREHVAQSGAVSPSLSGDGRYVAFTGDRAIFVHDRDLKTTVRLARGWNPSISGDGRIVAYVARTEGLSNIFVFDRAAGTAQTVSRSKGGGRANGNSANPALSGDGRIIVFQSEASNLVAGEDFNLLWDVFRFERDTGAMIRVSGDADAYWMEASGGPALDGSGKIIAFSSRHPVDASDQHHDFDLFVVRYK